MAKGDDIQERLIQFAARVIKACDTLPKTAAGKHIAGQLLRSGTSPAANHGEARSAESTADFIHKLKISTKELNESEVWLRIIIASDLIPRHMLDSLLDESTQLQRILNASIKTARRSAEQ
ncbi:MAG: four helix bundle protein [Caldilineaceae bacterium]